LGAQKIRGSAGTRRHGYELTEVRILDLLILSVDAGARAR
jgi:hypothetical protein